MFKVALLRSQEESDHLEWITSLEKASGNILYDVIDITKNNWLEQATSESYDLYICRPPGRNHEFKLLYDERVIILNRILKKKTYPSLNEILVYENKRFLSYFLKACHIPHPDTWVFYNRREATEFADRAPFPLVGKVNIGAGGSGVTILESKREYLEYVEKSFSRGIKKRWLPNLRRGNFLRRLVNRVLHPGQAAKHFKDKRAAAINDIQKGFILVQEYLRDTEEWRVVRIGESYFAHKKVATIGELKSGTSSVEWGDPPGALLDFSRKITSEQSLTSLALDILEDRMGRFHVLELQCYFGSKNPHQMIIDNRPGRYVFREEQWIFEKGEFNTNNSYDLRLAHIQDLLNPSDS